MTQAFLDLLDKAGFVGPPLVGCALLLWYALGFRAVLLRRAILARAADRAQRAERTPLGLAEALGPIEEELGAFSRLVTGVVVIAPLLGLLGTVSGMIETFDALGDQALFAQSGGIAGGISEALFSTQLGLAVAIPGLLAGRLLHRREDALRDGIDRLKQRLLGAYA